MAETRRVVVGVRFHDARRAHLLERALWSVAGQSWNQLDVVIACQGFDKTELSRVQDLAAQVFAISEVGFHVTNVENPDCRDLRARLLNEVLSKARHELRAHYVMFLDYDDLLFSHAVETLVDALDSSPAALAYGDVHVARLRRTGQAFFVEQILDFFRISRKLKGDMLNGNFLPLHSYLFDLREIDEGVLQYDETLVRLEDYELLLRVAANYPWTPMARNHLIGLYNFYSAVDEFVNTSPNVFDAAARHDDEWVKAKQYIVKKLGHLDFRTFLCDGML